MAQKGSWLISLGVDNNWGTWVGVVKSEYTCVFDEAVYNSVILAWLFRLKGNLPSWNFGEITRCILYGFFLLILLKCPIKYVDENFAVGRCIFLYHLTKHPWGQLHFLSLWFEKTEDGDKMALRIAGCQVELMEQQIWQSWRILNPTPALKLQKVTQFWRGAGPHTVGLHCLLYQIVWFEHHLLVTTK